MTQSSRREFLQTSTAFGTALAAGWAAGNVHAAGSDVIKVGLVGCGGRGTSAATQALNADKNVKLVAMGDAFEDRLQASLAGLKKDEAIGSKVDVKPEMCFTGFDAYKQVIANVDVVLLATPPHFRPIHLKAAVEAGKHVFAEKPCAVDAPGIRSVLDSCELARKKGLSLVAGLQMRYSRGHREVVKRIHDGAIGPIVAVQANDYRSRIWVKPRLPDQTDMQYHMRNWYYFTWLSGDFNVEQHVHMLDLSSWVIGDYPTRAVGMGGRQVRTGPEFGNIYDHFSVVHDYGSGAKLYAQCRQQQNCANDISVHVMGTKGKAELSGRKLAITTDQEWRYKDDNDTTAIQAEHNELFASIRAGKPINNGVYLSKSSLLAILGRMTAYSGQAITWEQALTSRENLSPERYAWDAAPPPSPIAIPGQTKFV